MINRIRLDHTVNDRGFFSVILQMLSIYMRHPNIPFYIDLSNWSIFQDKVNDNVWEYYFDQFYDKFETNYKIVNTNTIANYSERFLYIPQFNNATKNLKLKSGIIDIVNKYNIFNDKKVLGVHRRVTDKLNYPGHGRPIDLDIILKNIDEIKDEYDLIYFCSDDQKSMDIFEKKYKDKFYCYSDSFRSTDDKPIHTTPNTIKNSKKGEDVLVESILLSKCDYFLAVDSNVDVFAIYMTDSKYKYLG